ncbi:MAG TPA: hypothetical protein PKH39_02665 [Woeseiaceae bacterium]|nr:hypothetical protein [Woeseiaceae bacterium]
MALIKFSGPVSNYREETRVTSTQTSNTGYTQVRTEKEISFRVGNRPVSMKLPKGIELTDGDDATVVGSDARGGVKAILVRNDTIGMIYGMSTWYVMAWAIILTVVGIATLGIFIGIILVPLGLFLLYRGYQLMTAHKMMAAA